MPVTNIMNNTTTRRATIVVIFTAATLVVAGGALAATIPFALAVNINPAVFPPDSEPFGNTYGEWSANWWQWALSVPASDSPLADDTGEKCDVAQSGSVWFLAGTAGSSTGTSGGSAERECTIPADKGILFPIVNTECSTAEGNGNTESELRSCANAIIDRATFVQASVDGKPIQDVRMFRFESPLFEFTAVKDNVFGIPEGTTQSVADGYWILLKPLSPGDHEIHFHGGANFPATKDVHPAVKFSTEVTYHLTIE